MAPNMMHTASANAKDRPSTETCSHGSAQLAGVAAVIAVGLLISAPCLTTGLPGDQDGVYHVDYQRSFTDQFWSGDLYPRWLNGMNAGLGSPIFYLQYPAPYFAAALLSPLLPERDGQPPAAVALGYVAALAMVGSGLTAWFWLRTIVTATAASAGAIAYMILPYHLAVDLYSRAAIGEHAAFVWLPLTLLFAGRIARGQRRAVPLFALAYGLLLMTHLFTALLFLPVPVSWALLESSRGKRVETLARTAAAAMLGFAVAAVYILPLAEHRGWFDHRMLETDGSDNYNYRNHFGLFTEPFLRYAASLGARLGIGAAALNALAAGLLAMAVTTAAAWRMAVGSQVRRTLLVASGAICVAILIALPVSARLWHAAGLIQPIYFEASIFTSKVFVANLCTVLASALATPIAYVSGHRALALLACVTGAAALFMTLPYSRPVWDSVPQMAMLDFPWRFLTLLTFAAAVLVALAAEMLLKTRGVYGRIASGLFAATLLISSGVSAILLNVLERFASPVDLRSGPSIDVLLRTYAMSNPPEWLRSNYRTIGRRGLVETTSGTAVARRTGPRELELQVETAAPATVVVRQLYYPSWKAVSMPEDVALPLRASSPEGLVAFDVLPGGHRIKLELETTRSETIGACLSLAALILVGGLSLFPERRATV